LLSSFAFKLWFQALVSSFAFKIWIQALLSTFAFYFNLRRYNQAAHANGMFNTFLRVGTAPAKLVELDGDFPLPPEAGRCRLRVFETCVESAWFQRLKLKYGQTLSKLAFNFKLRRCTEGADPGAFIPVGPGGNRPISVYRFPRRALTLCPQLCMGIQPGARFPAWSAGALPATLHGHFTQAMYRNRPIARCVIQRTLNPRLLSQSSPDDEMSNICQALHSGAPGPECLGAGLEALDAGKGGVRPRRRRRQGLTLVHFSAQLEPFLTQQHTLLTPKYCFTCPKRPLKNPRTHPLSDR